MIWWEFRTYGGPTKAVQRFSGGPPVSIKLDICTPTRHPWMNKSPDIQMMSLFCQYANFQYIKCTEGAQIGLSCQYLLAICNCPSTYHLSPTSAQCLLKLRKSKRGYIKHCCAMGAGLWEPTCFNIGGVAAHLHKLLCSIPAVSDASAR